MAKRRQTLDSLISDDPAAISLIESHLEAAKRQADYWQRLYPREDIEPIVMQALYVAAFTFKPGKGSFYFWFRWKLRGALSTVQRRAKRFREGSYCCGVPPRDRPRHRNPPIRICSLNLQCVDCHFYRDDNGIHIAAHR